MTQPADIQTLLDSLAALREAKPRWREVPASTVQPPPLPDGSEADPIEIPARTELILDGLPDVLSPDGVGLDIGATLTAVVAAVQQIQAQQIRIVAGHVTFNTARILPAGSVTEVAVTWMSPPLAPVQGVLPDLDVGVAWQGRVTAAVKEGSVGDRGCTVLLSVVGGGVVISSGMPLTVRATGIYLYSPPITP